MIQELLKKAIKNSNWTITDLAKQAKCHRTAISSFINQNKPTLSVKNVNKLFEILGIKFNLKNQICCTKI